MARLRTINLAPEVNFDVADEYRLNEARREASKKNKLDLAIAAAAEGDADIARKAAAKKAEQEIGRQGVMRNYINDRENIGKINLGVVAPEYAPEQEFGPQVQNPSKSPNLAPVERRARIDLAAINPDMSEGFRTGMDTERETVAGRNRLASAETRAVEDQGREAKKFENDLTQQGWKNDYDTRGQAETRRHNSVTETLQRMGILAKGEGKAKGKILPSDKVISLADETSGLNLMKSMKGKAPKGLNPVNAWIKSINPYDTEMQGFNQYLATAKQIIGKNLEGGVLRLEDEKKYEKILPKPSDTPRTRAIKEAQLSEMLINRRNEHINSLANAGYDVEGQELSAMDENDEAILWAMKNPNDPRAKQLMSDLDGGR